MKKSKNVQDAVADRIGLHRIIRRQKKSRKSLTLLFSGVTFLILLSIVLVVGGLIFMLYQTGILQKMTERFLTGGAFALLAGFSLIIGAGMTYLLGRIMMKPMNRIINTMNALASGNFKARLHLGGMLGAHPSIKELTDSFNDMASELEHTEILRSDFINSFSHEFKTPIVSISGFAGLLQRGGLTKEQEQEYTGIIYEESLRLSDLATSVLNLTKIENQTILTDRKRYNLSEQLRSCMLLLEDKWTKKDLEPELDFDEYEISANEELMKMVWINLLDNAVKFSEEKGKISVGICKEAGRITVTVGNDGAGIPEEDCERIFGKFYQCDRSHASKGNGIGLAIVKKVVALHGGSVSAESKNGHTVLTVILPTED